MAGISMQIYIALGLDGPFMLLPNYSTRFGPRLENMLITICLRSVLPLHIFPVSRQMVPRM